MLEWIEHGVQFDLTSPIPPFFHTQISHEQVALDYWRQTLKPHYLQSGAIRQIPAPPPDNRHISKCFFVSKSSGGWRLVIDLRFINEHFEPLKIKFENLSLLKFANKDLEWGAKMDLSDAYHHLCLHPSLRPYFQFSVAGEFFEVIAVPFGWNLAPYVFTKFTRPVLTALRYPEVTRQAGY